MTFKIELISKQRQKSMENSGAWGPSAPVSITSLRSVFVSYIDFEENIKHDGEIIVLAPIAQATVAVFRELLKRKFPIHSVRPIDEYQANDDISVMKNNTSAYCFRPIEGTNTLSVHSYGVAIDINPYMNPYIAPPRNPGGMVEIADYKMDFLQRFPAQKGMVEPIVDVFKKYGFGVWGGHWKWPLDYHHFQTTRTQARIMAGINLKTAKDFFDKCIQCPKLVKILEKAEIEKPNKLIKELIQAFEKSPETFFQALDTLLSSTSRT